MKSRSSGKVLRKCSTSQISQYIYVWGMYNVVLCMYTCTCMIVLCTMYVHVCVSECACMHEVTGPSMQLLTFSELQPVRVR